MIKKDILELQNESFKYSDCLYQHTSEDMKNVDFNYINRIQFIASNNAFVAGAEFMKEFIRYIEAPSLLLLEQI